MTRDEYSKRLDWLFPEAEVDSLKFPAKFLLKGALKNNFNLHNKRIVKKLCISKMKQLIGLSEKKRHYIVKVD